MEVLHLNKENVGNCAAWAEDVLRAGGVVLYPTDTLYGLGVDAFSDAAVAKIYTIKGRNDAKPIHTIVADMEMAGKYGKITDDASDLIAQLPRGLLTVILSAQARSASSEKKPQVGTGVLRGISNFGFRIPDSDFCIKMVRAFGKPVTATSANKSGELPERSVEKILEQLGDAASSIDLVIDAGELPERKPSTVVDLTGDKPRIVREGAIPIEEIKGLLAAIR